MKDTSDPSDGEFSVRDQFAGTGAAAPPPRAIDNQPDGLALRPATPGGEPSPPAPREPLRRRLSPENLTQLIDWPQLARGVWNRVWILALLTGLGALTGLYGRIKMGKPRYEARSSMLYRADWQKQALSSPSPGVAIKGLSRATATSLVRRAGNLEKVISCLKLTMSPEELGWRVQTQSERNSEIILLRVDFMPSPELAVATANEVIRVALEDNRAFYRKQALQLAEQFKLQFDVADAEATIARESLIAYQTRHQMLEPSADTKAFLDSMGAVSERLHTARIARDSQTIRIANYRKLIAELPDEVVQESFEDNPLKRRIANSEVALMEARTRYGPENPRVLQMEDAIREMRRTMADPAFDATRERVYVRNPAKQEFEMEVLRLEAEQKVLDRSVTQIEQQAADLTEKYKHLPAQQLELAALHQKQSAAEALVHDLEKSMADARRTADIDLCDFEILEPARTASASQGKLAALLPVLLIVLGACAGTGVCAVLALADPTLKSAGQIERLYTLPCLGTVPGSKDDTALPEDFLPACRAVYQRLSGSPATDGARMFCILSACQGDGKSTLAFQIARYWAALGIKTACLDFDSAPNPWMIPADNRAGIEDYLSGRATWEEMVFMQEGIACFKRQRDTGDLPERMHGKMMRRFIETLRAQYGCVIIEAPAWLTAEPSARMLAEMAGRSIWIAASPASPRPVLNKAFDSLDRAGIRPSGLILNRIEEPNDDDKRSGSTS